MGDRSGEVRVGAKLLADAYEDEGLDEPIKVSFHRLALLGRENPLARWHCGQQASRVFRQR